jgi:hypothetical protein
MPQYTYLAVGHNYFPTRCNLVLLVWTLLFRYKNHHLDSLGLRRRQVPGILKSLFRHRYKHAEQGASNILTLPAFGHLCIPVHKGYKIFDFSRSVATKVFDQDIDTLVAESEIEAVRKVSSLSFTPTLIEAKPGSRWYSETFIPGERSSRTESSVPDLIFNQVIVNHICEMVLSNPVRTLGLQEYTNSLSASVEQQLMQLESDHELSATAHEFIRTIIQKLKAAEYIPVQLGFTHGDFSFVNFIFHHKKKIAVIDWESAQHRSILHDLHNYFLTELYYGRTQGNLVKEINDSISLIAWELLRSNKSIEAETLEKSRDTYRWLYYIERMLVLLDREPSEIQKNVIRHSIETFSQHETSTSSRRGNSQTLFAKS